MKEIFIPKVLFLSNKAEEEARMFFWLCYPKKIEWNWSKYTYRKHPELEKRLGHVKSKKKFYRICLRYIQEYYKEHRQELIHIRHIHKHNFDKFGGAFLKELSKHFETGWPKSHNIIRAYITIGSTCPRFLDSWSFWIPNKAESKRVRKVCYHELVHFLWFKKWREVFFDANPKEFERPHLIWKLSEIMAPIILNHHPKIKKMGQLLDPGYEEFQKVKIGKIKLIPYFECLYKKHLKSKKSFEFFLKKLLQVAEKHRITLGNI